MIVDESVILAAYRNALERAGDEDEAHKAAETALAKINPEVSDDFLIAVQVAVILARHILSGDLESDAQRRTRFTRLPR